MRYIWFQSFLGLICLFVIAGGGKVEVPTPPEIGDEDAGGPATPPGGCESDSECESKESCLVGTCNKESRMCTVSTKQDACFIDDLCFAKGQEKLAFHA